MGKSEKIKSSKLVIEKMIYSKLIKHPNLWERLTKSINKNKLPHAMLFHGASGTGKEAFAIELAGLLNCNSPSNGFACGDCSSCKRVKSFQHEDIKLVVPLPRNKTLSSKDSSPLNGLSSANLTLLQEQMKQKGKNPYSRIQLPLARTILINSIREIRKNITMSIVDNGWRVILIFDAELLCIPNDTSAIALLKVLEEPPPKTVFILVTSDVSIMLDTIRSRCQQYYFPPLKNEDIQSYLNINQSDETLSQIASQICNGDVRLAESISTSQDNLKSELKLFINAVFFTNGEHWQKISDYLGNLKRKNMDSLAGFFRTNEYFIRDLLVFSSSNDTSNLVFTNFSEQIQKITTDYPHADWHACIQTIENTFDYIRRNGYLPLMISTMLIDFQGHLKGNIIEKFDIHDWLAS